MRRLVVCVLIVFWFVLDVSVSQAQSDQVSEVIQRVNALRAAYGMPAYRVDHALMNAAQAQADWCAENNHIGHDGPGGNTPNDRAQLAGYGGGEPSYATENQAHRTMPYHTAELVVRMWQGDWGHLQAMILTNYEHIGVDYAEANGYSWFILMAGWVGSPVSPGDSQEQASSAWEAAYSPFVMSDADGLGAIYHEVQVGQTAWTIAARYGVALAELLDLNDLTEDSILHLGDILTIRPPEHPESTPTPQPNTSTPEPSAEATAEQLISSQTMAEATEAPALLNPEATQAAVERPGAAQEIAENPSSRITAYSMALLAALGAVVLLGMGLVRNLRR